MIVSTGVMRAIAASHPQLSLDVLASPANASLVRHAPYLANVIVFDKKKLGSYLPTAARLRRAGYDAVIDCMVTAPSVTTLLLILASGARHRIGIAGRGNDSAFSLNILGVDGDDAHMVERIAALATAFGEPLSASERRPVLDPTAAELAAAHAAWGPRTSARRVLVNVSAGTTDRLWPNDRYVAVMRRIRCHAPDAKILIISSPADAERGAAIAHQGDATLVRTPGFRDAIALVATADFVFTPDTSIGHAAAAFKTPAVAMYRFGTRTRWALYDAPGESIEHTERNLDDLGLDRVLPAIDRVWQDVVSRRD
jgi:ADP-heptose:LPS heptosyltransferase